MLAPYVSTSRAAGSLSMVVGTHAVPGCDAALSRVCNEWAAKEKVQLKLDIVDGFNLLMTVFSEGRGKSGHDIAGLVSWAAASQAANLETVDDVMQPLIARHGPVR